MERAYLFLPKDIDKAGGIIEYIEVRITQDHLVVLARRRGVLLDIRQEASLAFI